MVAAPVTILIAATETLAEIVVVLALVYIKATVAVARVLIGIRTLVVGMPPILAVCLSGPVAFRIAIVHSLSEHIRAVLVDLVVAAGTAITIDRSRVEIRIMIVIVVSLVPETDLLLTRTL